MDGVKMTHRSNPTTLPSIHSGMPKPPEIGSSSPDMSGPRQHSRLHYASAKSLDASTSGRFSNAAMAPNSGPATVESMLPFVGEDEHIDMGRIRIERRSHKNLLPPSIRHMAASVRTKSGHSLAQSYFTSTLDPPLPFQPQYFKSSTILKMVPVNRRHQDMFVEKTTIIPREKPLIIHSERYQYADPLRPGFDRLGQRERMLAEREYMHRLKAQKLARETLPHREARELLMGGQKASFNERFDVKDELRRLKAIVLPVNARELYHGKGIQLPENHSSVKPRHRMPPPLPVVSTPDPEEELQKEAALYRHTRGSLDGLRAKPSYKKPKAIKSKIDNHNFGRSQTLPPSQSDYKPALSRRSSESNFMTLPEDGDIPEAPPSLSGLESEGGDFVRALSRETVQPSTVPRAESEMDIILQEHEPLIPNKPAKASTPIKAPTPNPLKAADLTLYHISEHEMKEMFLKLDTDSDGHLMYQQVEPQFPPNLQPNQKKYLKQIYDITSASTFFGVKEFVTMKCLCEEVSKLDDELMLNGYSHLNFSTLNTTIVQYTELFQQVDRTAKGKIAIESLEDILCTALQREKTDIEHGLSELRNVLKVESGDVNKVKFIAGIPYFLTIPSIQKPTEPMEGEEAAEKTELTPPQT